MGVAAINSDWPEAKIAQLRELVDAGHGSPAIAQIMGISRNSVCGKAGRLNLTFKTVAAHRIQRERKPRKPHRAGAITLPAFDRWCAQCGGILGGDQKQFCSVGCNAIHQLELARRAPRKAPMPVAPPAPKEVVYSPFKRCQWPTSSGRPWKFCGDATAPGRPYCAAHVARAYAPRRAVEEQEAA